MRTVIKARGLVDVESGTLVGNPFVMLEDECITSVGSQDALPALDASTRVVDLTDHYLLPGLINSHAHLCFPSGGQSMGAMTDVPNEVLALLAAKNARLELESGVTTVKDCGARAGITHALRRAIEMEITSGPGLFLCDSCLTMSGGHGSICGEEVDGIDAVSRAVRRRIKQGADFIKVIATGGGTPGTHPGYASYSVAEIQAATDTAHRVDRKVAAHCRGIPGIQHAIDGGVDHIEHACCELPDGRLQFDPRLADRIAAKGIYVTPTMRLYRDLIDAFNQKRQEGTLLPAQARRLEILPYSVEEKLKALRGLLEAGVKCVAGNDAGLPFTGFGRLWQELEMMVDGGMTPVQAITAATLTAAEAMDAADRLGSITAGKQADIIAVRSDPTVDITSLATVSFVMCAGRQFVTPPAS